MDAFLAMSSNRVPNRQVREFIRNGEEGSALEVLNQIVANSHAERARRGTDVSRTPSRRSVRTDTRDSRESRRRRYRPRSEIEGEMIVGDPRGIATGTVRGADVTGGGVMIADRLNHEGCGR